jgi:excisionase family DNA binding protein
MPSMKLLSTSEAAAALNLTVGRVQQLIWEERLPAQRVGSRYVINEDDLKLVKDIKRGRPRKAQSGEASRLASKKKGGKK